MSPARLVMQPVAREEPLAFALLAAQRMRYWESKARELCDGIMERGARAEAESWEGVAMVLVAQGRRVPRDRASQLGLQITDAEAVGPVEVPTPAFPCVSVGQGGERAQQIGGFAVPVAIVVGDDDDAVLAAQLRAAVDLGLLVGEAGQEREVQRARALKVGDALGEEDIEVVGVGHAIADEEKATIGEQVSHDGLILRVRVGRAVLVEGEHDGLGVLG